MLLQKRYKRALVIGAGSGRDIASALLLTEGLRKQGTKVDLAGFLTPWAMHTFNGKLEKPVNRLLSRSRKFRINRRSETLDCYFEPILVKLNREMGLGLENIFLLSLHHGSRALEIQLQDLASSFGYDLILAVDVGGDILARKKDLPSLMTPIVDQSCLKALSGLQTDADMLLAVISPGVDGEIPRRRLKGIFQELEQKGCFLHFHCFRDSVGYKTFVDVNTQINQRVDSKSRTFETITRMLAHDHDSSIVETYRKEIRVGQTTWSIPFPVDLELSLIDKVFLFDLRLMACNGCIDGTEYSNVLDAFIDLKRNGAGGTEVDLSFIPLLMRNGTYVEPVFILVPCELAKGKLREEILQAGLSLVMEGRIRKALVMKRDLPSIPDELVFGKDDDFMFIGR